MSKIAILMLSIFVGLPSYAGKVQKKIDAILEKTAQDIKNAEQGNGSKKDSASSTSNTSSSALSETAKVARVKDRKKQAKRSKLGARRKGSSEMRSPASSSSADSPGTSTGVR